MLGSGSCGRTASESLRRALRRPRLLLLPVGSLIAVGLLGASPALALGSPPSHPPNPGLASLSSLPFTPSFSAGTAETRAGAFSPVTVTIGRPDDQEELGAIALTAPPGLLAALGKVGICSGPRADAGSCPASSQIGTVTVGLGPSFSPLYTEGGAYLTGPYKSAPFGIAIGVPVLVGLFDFGEVVSRASLSIDPSTAALSIASDPLPQSFDGFPLQIRAIRLDLDRRGFTFNPTNCGRSSFAATLTSASGAIASESSPFRATRCGKLPFEPKLRLRLAGQTNRGGHPKLTTVLSIPRGSANLERISLALPPTEMVDSAHLKSPCTRAQFAAAKCPRGSVIGFARAVTPILRKPLEGPVYLRTSSHPLPDLVVALHGEVDLDLAGRIETVPHGLRVAFANVPDAPMAKFTLTLDSGRRGLLVNGANLCSSPARAAVRLGGQNGAGARRNVPLRAPC